MPYFQENQYHGSYLNGMRDSKFDCNTNSDNFITDKDSPSTQGISNASPIPMEEE